MQNQKIQDVTIRSLEFHRDQRGWLVELFRFDELQEHERPVMSYVSMTFPGHSRGPHEHRQQMDVFCFFGPGDMTLYLWDARPESTTFGTKMALLVGDSHPCMVIVPPGVVHGYKNDSSQNVLVFNAPNQLFAGHHRSGPVDEIRHECDPNSIYRFD